MNIGKRLVSALTCVWLAACSVDPEPVAPSEPENPRLLVSGEVVRVDREFSYKGEANFQEGAHAVVTLCYVRFADAPCESLVEQRIENVRTFPIPFLLEGDPTTFFSGPGDYVVSARVYMGPSDEVYIGDFLDNIYNDIEGPTPDFSIRVSGLERCGTPESGGACATRERP